MATRNQISHTMDKLFGNADTPLTEEMKDNVEEDARETVVEIDIEPDASCYTSTSETSSCNSETLLIAPSNKTEEKEQLVENSVSIEDVKTEDKLQITFEDITDNFRTQITEKASQKCVCHSNRSMFEDDYNDTENLQVTPLHVIGSGWEFGSITSIHRRPLNVGRSRSNTIEGRTNNMKGEGNMEERLLYKVFSSQVGDIDFRNKKGLDGQDQGTTFLGPNQDDEIEKTEMKRTSSLRNIFAVSAGVMLLHVAFYGLRNLQSSMNAEGGIGVISMGIACGMYLTGSFVSPFIVQRFGPKRCVVAGTIAHIFYIFANYYVCWYTLIPSSAILGFGSAILWNSVSTYITEMGIYEAEAKTKNSGHVISFYFGLFFFSIQLATVIGNLISSLILAPKPPNQDSMLTGTTSQSVIRIVSDNATSIFSSITSTTEGISALVLANYSCGIGFVDGEDAIIEQTEVDDLDKLFLLGTFAFCGVLAVFVLCVCLDRLPEFVPRHSTGREVVSQAVAVISMLFDGDFVLVVPMCLYSYMSVGFVIADVLKAYITCSIGMYMVGYTMICFGLCGSISSYVSGKLLQHTGRVPIFVTATVMNVVSMAAMVVWRPVEGDVNYLFVLIGAWGFADGIWQSQINSLISTVFVERYETAFGSFRVLQGIAGMVVFGISSVFGIMTKLFITFTMCVISLVFYLIMELRNRNKKSIHESQDPR